MQYRILVVAFAALLQTVTAVSQIRLVAVGRISKLEKTKRSFELKSTESTGSQRPPSGGSGFGSGRFPDATVSWPPRPEPRPSAGAPPEANGFPLNATTVFLTNSTLCKDVDKVMSCADLKAADQVRVTGDEKSEARGKGLYATEVVRLK